MQNLFMKCFLILPVLILKLSMASAQPLVSLLDILDLTPQQKIEMKVLIRDYQNDQVNKREKLRNGLMGILNKQQQARFMRWRNMHRRPFTAF